MRGCAAALIVLVLNLAASTADAIPWFCRVRLTAPLHTWLNLEVSRVEIEARLMTEGRITFEDAILYAKSAISEKASADEFATWIQALIEDRAIYNHGGIVSQAAAQARVLAFGSRINWRIRSVRSKEDIVAASWAALDVAADRELERLASGALFRRGFATQRDQLLGLMRQILSAKAPLTTFERTTGWITSRSVRNLRFFAWAVSQFFVVHEHRFWRGVRPDPQVADLIERGDQEALARVLTRRYAAPLAIHVGIARIRATLKALAVAGVAVLVPEAVMTAHHQYGLETQSPISDPDQRRAIESLMNASESELLSRVNRLLNEAREQGVTPAEEVIARSLQTPTDLGPPR